MLPLDHRWVTSSTKKRRLKVGMGGLRVAVAVGKEEHEKAIAKVRAK